MRDQTTEEFCTIRIYKSSLEQIKDEQKNFQKCIGGGIWSIADTVRERNKILHAVKMDYKPFKQKIIKLIKKNIYKDKLDNLVIDADVFSKVLK